MSKALTKLVTPASYRLVCHDYAALEKQFLDVAQAQLKAEIPSNSADDDTRRETVTVTERFRFLHHVILSDGSRNLTSPAQLRPRHDLLHRLKEHIKIGWPTVLFKSGALIGRHRKGLLFHPHSTIYRPTALTFFSALNPHRAAAGDDV